MANRIIHQKNSALANAEALGDFYAKRFYNEPILSNISYSAAEINMHYRLKGFERYRNGSDEYSQLNKISRILLGSAYGSRRNVAYTLYSNRREVGVYISSHYCFADVIKETVLSNLNSPRLSNEFINSDALMAVQRFNGFVVGSSAAGGEAVEMLLNYMQHRHCMVNILFIPLCNENMISDEISEINANIQDLQSVSKYSFTYGGSQARHFDYDNQQANDTINILNSVKQLLNTGRTTGLFRIAIHVSAETAQEYGEIINQTVSALFLNGEEGDMGAKHYVSVGHALIRNDQWAVPFGNVASMSFSRLYSDTLLNIALLDSAAKFLALPISDHPGYHTAKYGSATDSDPGYARYQMGSAEGVVLGHIHGGGEFKISIDQLQRHAFFAGATQYGKSTTAKQFLLEARRQNIPFVAIEAAKKDYWELKAFPEMSGVRVLSAGYDAPELKINPFEPEEGTMLDTHIQYLIHAFLAYMSDEGPIPYILDALVAWCYEEKGWDLKERARRHRDLDYPTLEDMLRNYGRCIDNIGYSKEIRDNMKGVFNVRLRALCGIGALNTSENISVEEMYRSSCVVELDDFSGDTRPFVASILAIKAQEFSRNCPENHRLERLLLLEEAHHILPNPGSPETGHFARECSRHFSSMLAEVSAYGTGMIIVDQRPSLISPSAMSNTGIKIIHRLQQGADLDAIQDGLRITDVQTDIISRMDVGEAAISLPRQDTVFRIIVDPLDPGRVNIASLFSSVDPHDRFSEIGPAEIAIIQSQGYSYDTVRRCIELINSRSFNHLSRERMIAVAGKLAEYDRKSNPLHCRRDLFDIIRTMN